MFESATAELSRDDINVSNEMKFGIAKRGITNVRAGSHAKRDSESAQTCGFRSSTRLLRNI